MILRCWLVFVVDVFFIVFVLFLFLFFVLCACACACVCVCVLFFEREFRFKHQYNDYTVSFALIGGKKNTSRDLSVLF
jgi:hypothetical protein